MCGLSAGEYKYAMHGAPVTNAGNSDISENPISFSSFPSPLPSSSQLSSKKSREGGDCCLCSTLGSITTLQMKIRNHRIALNIWEQHHFPACLWVSQKPHRLRNVYFLISAETWWWACPASLANLAVCLHILAQFALISASPSSFALHLKGVAPEIRSASVMAQIMFCGGRSLLWD